MMPQLNDREDLTSCGEDVVMLAVVLAVISGKFLCIDNTLNIDMISPMAFVSLYRSEA